MTIAPTRDLIMSQLDRLTPDQQKQALDYITTLADSDESLPPGTPGAVLARFIGSISKDDLNLMEEAIRDCDTVDLNDWQTT